MAEDNIGTANSRQLFLMRQNGQVDLADISRNIAIPEITKHTIMNYTLPDHQAGAKYSAFTYLHVDSNRPICGSAYNFTSPEMLECSNTDMKLFKKRVDKLCKELLRRELRGC